MDYLEPDINVSDDGKISITYRDRPDFAMALDFGHWLKAFPTGPIAFVHWQRAPKYQRRWGVLSRSSDGKLRYQSFTRVNISVPVVGRQFREDKVSSLPSAVLVAQNCSLSVKEGIATLVKL